MTTFNMSVSIDPGPMAFTRILCGASAIAITRVSCEIPPLETAYAS